MKRSVKTLALSAISSSPGSHPFIAGRVLGALNFQYGPFFQGSSARSAGGPVSCISVDFDVTEPSRFDDNRKGTLALDELADRYQIPITWAVCGKSAEDDTRSYHAILDSSTSHEIGVHTYSHLDATACSPGQFRADVERCIQVLDLVSPKTFVFPWNREAHFEVLRELGFRAFRGKNRAIGAPTMRDGLWNVRPVYYVDQKSLGAESLIKKYVELCISRGVVFHMWSHPWALVIDGKTKPMMDTMESVFRYMDKMRSERLLSTLTVGALAASLDLAYSKPAAPQLNGVSEVEPRLRS